MASLFQTLRTRVAAGRYVVAQHAAERLEERGILEWQVVDGIETGRLMLERVDGVPNPTIEVEQALADGTRIKAVWSYLARADVAKLVTVHYFDE